MKGEKESATNTPIAYISRVLASIGELANRIKQSLSLFAELQSLALLRFFHPSRHPVRKPILRILFVSLGVGWCHSPVAGLNADVNYPRKFFFLRDFSALALLTQKEKFGKRTLPNPSDIGWASMALPSSETPAEPARKI